MNAAITARPYLTLIRLPVFWIWQYEHLFLYSEFQLLYSQEILHYKKPFPLDQLCR